MSQDSLLTNIEDLLSPGNTASSNNAFLNNPKRKPYQEYAQLMLDLIPEQLQPGADIRSYGAPRRLGKNPLERVNLDDYRVPPRRLDDNPLERVTLPMPNGHPAPEIPTVVRKPYVSLPQYENPFQTPDTTYPAPEIPKVTKRDITTRKIDKLKKSAPVSEAKASVPVSKETKEKIKSFKMNPFRGYIDPVTSGFVNDKYLNIGSYIGNAGSKAIAGMYNKDAEDYNEAEKARREQFKLNHQLERERKQAALEDALNTEFVFGDEIDDKFLSNPKDVMTPEDYNAFNQFKSIISSDKEFNLGTPQGKKAYAQFMKAKEQAKAGINRLYAKYNNKLNSLGNLGRGESRVDIKNKPFSKDSIQEQSRIEDINRAIGALEGGKGGLIATPVTWALNFANATINPFTDYNSVMNRYKTYTNSNDLGNKMRKEGYKVTNGVGAVNIRRYADKFPNNSRLQEVANMVGDNEIIAQYVNPISKDVRLIIVGPNGTRDITSQLGADFFNVAFKEANEQNKLMR